MADNLQIGTVTSPQGTVATDEINGVHYSWGKIGYGGDGSFTAVDVTNRFPVNTNGTVAMSGTVPVSVPGTVNVNATGGTLAVSALGGTASVFVVNNGTVSVTGNVEVVNDVGNPLPVNVINNGTVSVTGSVEIANDSGNPVPVNGNIGGTVSLAGTSPVSVSSGTVAAAGESSVMYAGGVTLTPKFAPFDLGSSGSGTIVAAVTSKRIRVLSLFAMAGTAGVNIYFDGGGSVCFGGTANKIQLASGGVGFVLPYNPTGWMQTNSGSALLVNLSGAVAFSGGITYVEI